MYANTHIHLLRIDHPVVLLVNYWRTTVKWQGKEVLLQGAVKARKNERPSAIVLHKGQTQFNPIIRWEGALPRQPPSLKGRATGKDHSAEQLHPVSRAHSSRARGEVRRGGGKGCFWGFYMSWPFHCTLKCIKRNNKGHNRFCQSEKIPIFPFHFCCPCEISLGGFNDLWMSASSVTMTPAADTPRWQGVMYCVEVLPRCNFFMWQHLLTSNVKCPPLSHADVHLAS